MTKKGQSHTLKVAIFSATTNWVGDLLFYPLDAVSKRLMGNKHHHHNPFTYLINTIKTEKTKLYRGATLAFPATFIPSAIYITIYDTLMNKVSKIMESYSDRKELKLCFPFFISTFAEFVCLWPYLPVDTVRTRIQVFFLVRKMNHPDYNYHSLYEGLKDIYVREGFWRLYKSTKIYFTCKTMYTAIQFQVFEMIRYFAGPSKLWLVFNTIASTAIATTFVNPLQVLLTRYALTDTTKKKLHLGQMVEKIYRKQGIIGFYKGYGTQLLAHCLYALFWLPTYQILREHYGVQIVEG